VLRRLVTGMSIAEKKEEILILIERLRAGPQRGQPPGRTQDFSSQQLGERIAKRRQDLLSLRDKRGQAELDLLQDKLLGICHTLEERIARIEEMFGRTGSEISAGSRKRAVAGTDLAPDLGSMIPSFSADNSADITMVMPREVKAHSVSAAARERLYALSGALEEDTLPDVLQFVSSTGKSGVFAVEFGSDRIDLFFREGQIVHAVAGNLSGQQAFFAAMAVRVGRFFFDETAAISEETSIDGNTQFMILEALRQIDEDRRKE